MKKFTYVTVLLLLVTQFSFSQEKHSRIKITNPDQFTLNKIASEGIDLSCGSVHEGNSLSIDVSQSEINALRSKNIFFNVEIDDLQKFDSERSKRDLPRANSELEIEKAKTLAKRYSNANERSVSSVVQDNIIQYAECNEIDWAVPINYNLGTWAGCLTYQEMKDELDDMRTYSVSNSLDIVSVKANASSTGQKTWGNPASTIANPLFPKTVGAFSEPATYSGQGDTRWDPETIWYVRITGNESTYAEGSGSRPQMLFTSMIHSREVSALMNNIFFMWYIIENYNTDSAIKELVDNNELYFVPVVNPDGLRWNEHLDARLDGQVDDGSVYQRKNLRPNTGGTGNTDDNRGVDLNRNFDYFWGYNNIGSSGSPTSSTYRGPYRESEPETQIMVDFITTRNIKSAVWNHSYANSVPHPYGGIPTQSTEREDEYYRWHEEMTRYNRYLYGATIFYESNGLPDDWMMGGAADGNGSTGSGQAIIATTPEHGGQGFWPTPSTITPIAKQSMRISLGTAYYGGKYAKLHDLTLSNITTTSDVPLDFGIERIGQTPSDFTVTVTPISSNILSVVSPPTESGIPINTTTNPTFRNQKNVSATMQLDPAIIANEKIEYNVKLSNDDGIIYEANYEKYYQPTLLFDHDPDASGITGWDQSGGWNNQSADSYSGTDALSTGTYSSNATKILTTTNSYDFSGSNEVIIQFYTKWDIERNYDFVEVLASPNGGSSWISLCGNYTKPNATSNTTSHDNKSGTYANFQANSDGQIYDGDRMDNWVMEEIVIDNTYASLLSSNDVKIRFNFRTDGVNVNENYTTSNDGFFIDDFKIISLQIPCVEAVPTGLNASTVEATSAIIGWDAIPSATYDLRYRVTGSGTWTDVLDIATNNYNLTGLTASSNYDVEVRSKCDALNVSAYTTTVNFSTTAVNYCDSSSTNVDDEYISRVQLNTIDNASGAQFYSDFTGISTVLTQNAQYTITITPTWPGNTWNEAYSVWIDYNRDGDFTDAGEQVWTQSPTNQTSVSGNFTIPSNIDFGTTRMRVSMQYNSIPTSCQTFTYGEVEDYSVYLSFDGLMCDDNTWTPNAPDGTTGSMDVLVLKGNYAVASDVVINDLVINSNGSMTISKTGALSVNGNITGNNNLVLESDSNEYSSLIVTGTVSGNVAYKRHVNINAGGNDLIAPPVSGQIFSDFITTNPNIVSNGTNTSFLFGPFDKVTGSYVLFANTESSFLTAGTGYRAASTDDGTFTFSGLVNTGNVNVGILNSGPFYEEWNLIGNPYTSYISLSEFLSANTGQFDIQKAGVYGYDGLASDGWTIWNQAYSDANPGSVITPGQGFFVASKAGGGTVSFTPSMRSNGTSDDFIIGRSSNTNAISHLKIKLEDAGQLYYTDFYFTDNASLGLDPGYDSGIFGNVAPDFAIYSYLVDETEGLDMAIQSVSNTDLNNNIVIPLGINAEQGQQLTISIENTTLDSNVEVYLEDNLTNTITLLNTNDYIFTPSTELSGTGRFFLRFESGTLSTLENELDSLQIYNTSNPEKLHVKGLLSETSQLSIFDVKGHKVLEYELRANVYSQQMDISHLGIGVYVVEIKNYNQTKAKKIITM